MSRAFLSGLLRPSLLALSLLALLIAVSLPLAAQTTATTSITVDYEAWNTLASLAESRSWKTRYTREQALNACAPRSSRPARNLPLRRPS